MHRRRSSFDSRTPRGYRRKYNSTSKSCCLIITLTISLFLILLFFLVFSSHRIQSPSRRPSILEVYPKRGKQMLAENLNVTEEMLSPHSVSRQMSDQISLARSFIEIAKERSNILFAKDLTSQIRKLQFILSDAAITDSDPLTALTMEGSKSAIQEMALLLQEARKLEYDPAKMIVRLREEIEELEHDVKSISEKSLKYGQIAAEAIPRYLYCLSVRLTLEWFRNPKFSKKRKSGRVAAKLVDRKLFHFCIFSDNILAASVAVNSTALSSDNPSLLVFHIVTDEVTYAPMSAWFSMNEFHGATVEVQKLEDFEWLNSSYVPVLKQLQDSDTKSYYFSGSKDDSQFHTPIKYRNPKYLSILNHLRFYIPEVFPRLEKVVFLDDDVVVQKDLSPLFTIGLNGNVIGAVETCMETFHRFHKYLNFSNPLIREHFDPDACGWAFGMNVFDLVEWRRRNVTGIYHFWQENNVDRTLWKLGTLPPGLLTFYGLTEALDPSWHVLGFGYTNVDPEMVRNGAVLHFNGNAKPWMKIGKQRYRHLWEKYVDFSHPILHE